MNQCPPSLNQRIQSFYDRSTPLWLDTWGEHMHHGYYGPGGTEKKDRFQAQVDLVKELLQWGEVRQAAHILDAGCGVGGSARMLAEVYGARVLGVTLSPVQAERARAYTAAEGLQNRVRFQARDMMSLQPADGTFDLIWSLESAEHVADKRGMLELFHELLAPGGQFLIATWCHRAEPPGLKDKEQRLLGKLYRRYHLPPMVSIEDLESMAKKAGFRGVQSADWSTAVSPFWKAVIRSAFTWRGLRGLATAGWLTIQGAWAMQYMMLGYEQGLVRFGVFQGKRPARPERGEDGEKE
jgi:tocopherol O-methyltransferase